MPALRRLKQEGHEVKASLGYMERDCLEKANKVTEVKEYLGGPVEKWKMGRTKGTISEN